VTPKGFVISRRQTIGESFLLSVAHPLHKNPNRAMMDPMTLSDLAATHLQKGRVETALSMLEESLERLADLVEKAPNNVSLRLDLANTMHLLATLPLHSQVALLTTRSIDLAIQHAEAAFEIYADLNRRQDVSRVFETLAQLRELVSRRQRS